jgi:7-cyano-7-deazaguanine synthase
MHKAIVLLSGGIDSATALWLTKRSYEVYALSFKFHGRNKNEIMASKKLAQRANVKEHIIIDVGFLRQLSELFRSKDDSSFKKLGVPSIYIPGRNMVFFGIASYFSEIKGIEYIVTGHSITDKFPDAKPEYIKTINTALSLSSTLVKDQKTKIIMPLAKMNKTEIIRLALELQVPIELTWSCHKDRKIACGRCEGCISRLEAFKDLKMKDRVDYRHLSNR